VVSVVRDALRDRLNERNRYKGVFSKYGLKSSYKGYSKITILLTDVKIVSTGEVVTDHLWFNQTKRFKEIGPLYPGDVVAFDGRVTPYEKGYVSEREGIDERQIDYRLSYPTKINLVSAAKNRDPGIYLICPICGFYNDPDRDSCRRCYNKFKPTEKSKTDHKRKPLKQTTLIF